MHLRWALLTAAVLLMGPSIASAQHHIDKQGNPVFYDRGLMPHHNDAVLNSRSHRADYTIGAAVIQGAHAGRLVLAFHNPDPHYEIAMRARVISDTIQYDWLTVEVWNESTQRTLAFIEDREHAATETRLIPPTKTVFETIDLDARTTDLPPGEYHLRVNWDGHVVETTTFVPYQCHVTAPPLVPASPSKLPFVLLVISALGAIVVGSRVSKRAGTDDVRVPCSTL